MHNVKKPNAAIMVLALAMLWIGLLVGVSFLATPAKFLASNLSLPEALDIGRHTFGIFNRAECLLGLEAIILTLAIGDRPTLMAGIGVALAVALQTVWLLPLLDQRVALIIAGQTPPTAAHHSLYIVVDMGKAVLLAFIAARTGIKIAKAFEPEISTDDGSGRDVFHVLDV